MWWGNVTENIGEVEILKILCRNLSQNVEEKKNWNTIL